MEYTPEHPESRVLDYDAAVEAMNTLSDALTVEHPSADISLGITNVDEGFGVALRAEDAGSLAVAQSLVDKYIPGVPVSARITGKIRAFGRVASS